jgi:hypothetical protein
VDRAPLTQPNGGNDMPAHTHAIECDGGEKPSTAKVEQLCGVVAALFARPIADRLSKAERQLVAEGSITRRAGRR